MDISEEVIILPITVFLCLQTKGQKQIKEIAYIGEQSGNQKEQQPGSQEDQA